MYELALCAGIGGISLGLKKAGCRTVCYVERNLYRVQVLISRIRDGHLDNAPVWDDVTTFDGKPWRGHVDILSAGFPCQPFSVAGERLGTSDKRYLWPDVYRIICDVRPQYILLENVPGLLSMDRGRVFGAILADLAKAGYDAEWQSLSAFVFGYPHKRERIFIVAYPCQTGRQRILRRDLFQCYQAHSGWQSPAALDAIWSRLSQFEESVGESSVFGSNDGLPYRVERLESVGEAVVPQIAEYIGRCIMEII